MNKTINIIIGILVIAVIGTFLYSFYLNESSVTRKEFNEAHAIVKARFDTVDSVLNKHTEKLDSIFAEIKDVKDSLGNITDLQKKTIDNQTNLQAGQFIIYEEVQYLTKRNEPLVFKIKKFLKK